MSEIIEIPNSWKAGIITNDGLGLLSKLVKGHTLSITKAEIGAGWVDPEQLNTLQAVVEPMQALTFATESYPEAGKCIIPCKLTNAEVTENYIGRMIGLYAQDPDKGEILFYVTQVEDEDGGTGIPAAHIIPSYSATWNLVIYYGMADGVDITVDPAGAITQEDMETYFEATVEETFFSYTDEEIDALLGTYDGDISGGGSGGSGTMDHSLLYNRNIPNQHTIQAIEGLEEALAEATEPVMTEDDVDDIWDEAMSETEGA